MMILLVGCTSCFNFIAAWSSYCCARTHFHVVCPGYLILTVSPGLICTSVSNPSYIPYMDCNIAADTVFVSVVP